jgi:hypothetical protein
LHTLLARIILDLLLIPFILLKLVAITIIAKTPRKKQSKSELEEAKARALEERTWNDLAGNVEDTPWSLAYEMLLLRRVTRSDNVVKSLQIASAPRRTLYKLSQAEQSQALTKLLEKSMPCDDLITQIDNHETAVGILQIFQDSLSRKNGWKDSKVQ